MTALGKRSCAVLYDNTAQHIARAITRAQHKGKDELCAALIELYAKQRWHQPSGLLADPQVELTAAHLHRRLAPRGVPSPPGGEGVLHVLTRGAAIGGHTRLLARWLELDRARKAEVVVTRQSVDALPAWFHEAARRAGVTVYSLGGAGDSYAQRAAKLADAAGRAACIVLHTHPDDVVPLLAFGPAGTHTRPVLHMNHASQAFWLGIMSCDQIICTRPAAAALTRQARGRCLRPYLLPIPLVEPQLVASERSVKRSAARKELRLAEGDTVILSVARAIKYQSDESVSFPALAARLVQQKPSVRMLVVGPEQVGAWRKAFNDTDGRVEALGQRRDLSAFYWAADIFADSFPFCSVTSVLEAGLHALPVVALARPQFRDTPLVLDGPALDKGATIVSSGPEFVDSLVALVEQPDERAHLGERLRELIVEQHAEAQWAESVSAIYEQAATLNLGASPKLLRTRAPDPFAALMTLAASESPEWSLAGTRNAQDLRLLARLGLPVRPLAAALSRIPLSARNRNWSDARLSLGIALAIRLATITATIRS